MDKIYVDVSPISALHKSDGAIVAIQEYMKKVEAYGSLEVYRNTHNGDFVACSNSLTVMGIVRNQAGASCRLAPAEFRAPSKQEAVDGLCIRLLNPSKFFDEDCTAEVVVLRHNYLFEYLKIVHDHTQQSYETVNARPINRPVLGG